MKNISVELPNEKIHQSFEVLSFLSLNSFHLSLHYRKVIFSKYLHFFQRRSFLTIYETEVRTGVGILIQNIL